MAKKPGTNPKGEFVFFDVVYEDGSQRSNRRVPAELLSGLEKDAPALGFIIEQDREIAEKSGRAPLKIERARVEDFLPRLNTPPDFVLADPPRAQRPLALPALDDLHLDVRHVHRGGDEVAGEQARCRAPILQDDLLHQRIAQPLHGAGACHASPPAAGTTGRCPCEKLASSLPGALTRLPPKLRQWPARIRGHLVPQGPYRPFDS